MNHDEKHNRDPQTDRGDKDHIAIDKDGIHITDHTGDEVHINRGGLHINSHSNDAKEAIRQRANHSFPLFALATLLYVIWVLAIAIGDFALNGQNLYVWGLLVFLIVPLGDSITEAMNKKRFPTGIFSLLCLVGFLLAGLLFSAWHPAWILLLFIPLIESIPTAIREKNGHKFAFWDVTLILFLLLGFAPLFGIADHGLWHPGWVVFLLIPAYHSFVSYLRKR
ncbi:MAG: hypothetical protein HFE77_05130 [Clostridiales bacterium]|nr:hypothetical protein [Clostridiales bacterium]